MVRCGSPKFDFLLYRLLHKMPRTFVILWQRRRLLMSNWQIFKGICAIVPSNNIKTKPLKKALSKKTSALNLVFSLQILQKVPVHLINHKQQDRVVGCL